MNLVTDIAGNTVKSFAGKAIESASVGIKRFFGRNVKDWSICTMCAFGIAGVTIGVIGAIISSPIVVAISVAIFAAALFLGIFRIIQMNPEKDFKEKIEEWDETINEADKSLIDFDQELEKHTRIIANLGNTKEKLEKQLEEQKELNAKFTNELEERALELEETHGELNDKVEQLDILEDIHSQLTNSIQSLASEISNMSNNDETLTLVEAKFSNLLKEFQQHDKSFGLKISNLHEKSEIFQKHSESLKGLNDEINEISQSFQNDLSQMEDKFAVLDECTAGIKSWTSDIRSLNDQVEEINKLIDALDADNNEEALTELDNSDAKDDLDFLNKTEIEQGGAIVSIQ